MASEGLPERVQSDRLLLRHLTPDDIVAWEAAIIESLDALLPFMPWAHDEPIPAEARLALLDEWHANYALQRESQFGTFFQGELVGGAGLMFRRGRGVLEIGYWVRTGYQRKGIATEVVSSLVRAAFVLEEVERVEIWCDAANVASARVAESAGFTLAEEVSGEVKTPGDCGLDQRWVLRRRS